jgi:hypothetical protein
VDQTPTLYFREAKDICVPNIRSNNADAFDYRPEDGCADLGLSRKADGKKGSARAKIVNRLLVRSALYTIIRLS